jgi:hypothetical protein
MATFYAYNTDGVTLRKKPLSLSYPVQVRIQGRTVHEDYFTSKIPAIEFIKGIHETEIPEVIEFLQKYNTGGTLSKEKDALGRPFTIKPDYSLAIVKEEAPVNTTTVEKRIETIREVRKVSAAFLSVLDAKALRALIVDLQIALPQEDNLTKTELIDLIDKAGHIG